MSKVISLLPYRILSTLKFYYQLNVTIIIAVFWNVPIVFVTSSRNILLLYIFPLPDSVWKRHSSTVGYSLDVTNRADWINAPSFSKMLQHAQTNIFEKIIRYMAEDSYSSGLIVSINKYYASRDGIR